MKRAIALLLLLVVAELFAKSPAEFMVRVDPSASVRFEGDNVFVTIQGLQMVGTKMP